MFEFGEGGDRWGITFFHTSRYLPYPDVVELVKLSTLMYLSGEKEQEVDTDDYRGRVYTRREYGAIESFGGMVYYAELETARGRDTMKFLVTERTPGRKFSFSMS